LHILRFRLSTAKGVSETQRALFVAVELDYVEYKVSYIVSFCEILSTEQICREVIWLSIGANYQKSQQHRATVTVIVGKL